VHIEPFGLYSTWFADVEALPEYAEVILPSDSVNVDRSLTMLHGLGLIDCRPGPGALATVSDVRANPRNLVFKEQTSWLLGDVREDFDAVFLFGNQAMEWGVDVGSACAATRPIRRMRSTWSPVRTTATVPASVRWPVRCSATPPVTSSPPRTPDR
jgi:D-methionine transport system substrate-binding protein